MKKFILSAMALVALTMFSCSNEEEVNVTPPAGEKAYVTLTIKGAESSSTRAIGNSSNDDEIANYIAFFFDKNGQLVTKQKIPNATTTKLTTTTAADSIYIIANFPQSGLQPDPFASVTNKSDMESIVGSLSNGTGTSATSTQTPGNLWMEGKGKVEMGTGNTGTATVIMKFLAAKIEVTVRDARTNNDGTNGSIKIENTEVLLLNAGGQAKFFVSDTKKMTQDNYFSGMTTTSNSSTEVNFLKNNYLNGNITQENKIQVVSGFYFYAFGNSSDTQPTILAIKAKRTEGGNETDIYYPVAFSTKDVGSGSNADLAKITPGCKYTVTITLSGDVAGGGGGGTTDPEEPLVPVGVTVNITKATWTVKTVGKEFK